jgi:hypothetical protein
MPYLRTMDGFHTPVDAFQLALGLAFLYVGKP